MEDNYIFPLIEGVAVALNHERVSSGPLQFNHWLEEDGVDQRAIKDFLRRNKNMTISGLWTEGLFMITGVTKDRKDFRYDAYSRMLRGLYKHVLKPDYVRSKLTYDDIRNATLTSKTEGSDVVDYGKQKRNIFRKGEFTNGL
jgi:hypothetical protein